ncbi:MAG: GNAT family N-acetyltransferase [Oscillospiraceae bacterium]|nr:GNAT family N-acetyltransferase [Oscillospiraceae bacterium]
MTDLLVNLYNMPKIDIDTQLGNDKIIIKRAMPFDKRKITDFVNMHFDTNEGWAYECEKAIFNNPSSCFIAVKDCEIIGFACYDSTALGFFGPTGVSPQLRGKGIGKALLGKCLEAMKEKGYGYAIIGYVGDAIDFYQKTVNAVVIENSTTDKTVFKNLVFGK